MNKKYAILSIVLIALMTLALIPGSKAYQTGPGSSATNTTYEMFGPKATTLIMNVYTSYASMWSAFNSQTIDFLDGNILPTDYNTISSNPAFTTGDVELFGLREFDFNSIVAPFNVTDYRLGLASCIDRLQWMTTYFPSGGLPAYTVLQSQGSWADPLFNTSPAIPQDFLAAYTYFCEAEISFGGSGAPIVDPNNASASTWAFPNSYPTAASNPNPTSYPGTGPAVPTDTILFYIRSEAAERQASGTYLVNEAHTAFANWALSAAGHTALTTLFAAHPTWAFPGWNTVNAKPPEIDFLSVITTSATTSLQVMKYYRFQLYTGGWTTGSTPDFMEVWESAYAPQNNGWSANAYNFGSVLDPTFDNYVDTMVVANITYAHTLGDYAQEELIPTQCDVIPWYIYSGKTATLTADYDTVNALGVGFGNWYSFFDAYPTSGAPGYSLTNPTLTWGWESDMHQNANPISATWAWDWYMLGEIYDALVSLNPYDTSNFRVGLADNYSVLVTPSVNGGNTVLTFHLRNDVFWQDVPAKVRTAYTVDGGAELNGPITNIPLTVLDVAYTYEMARDFGSFSAVHINPDALDVDHVVVSPIWASAWPWTTGVDPPWYNSTYAVAQGGFAFQSNFVQFNSALDSQTIQVYLNDQMTWLAFYTDMSIPIFPLHIFEYLACGAWIHNGVTVPNVFTMNLSPLTGGADLLYGTGPFIWLTGTAGASYNMIAYATGASYRGITEQNSYFWQPIRLTDTMTLGGQPETETYLSGPSEIVVAMHLQNFDASNAYTVTVTKNLVLGWYNGADWTTIAHTALTQTQTGIVVPAGGSKLVTFVFPVTWPATAVAFVKHDDYRITITAAPYSWIVGRSNMGGDYYSNGAKIWHTWDNPFYPSSLYYIAQNNKLAGDIAGGKLADPFWGADGIVNSKDMSLIASNWLSLVPTGTDPISGLGRADINWDGIVSSKDAAQIAAAWLTTWSPSTIPNPLSALV